MKKYLWDKTLYFLNFLSPSARRQLIAISYLTKHYGHFNSIKTKQSVDSKNNPLPWITYPTIEYLSNIDFSKEIVFEVGSGNSTLWFAKICKKIFSVESEKEWFNKILEKTKNLDNVELIYVENVNDVKNYDNLLNSSIMFVDGLERENALDYLINNFKNLDLKFVIVDNSDRQVIFNKIQEFVKVSGWVDIEFVGFGPINRYIWSTTVIINPNKKIPRLHKHISPIINSFK